VPVVEKARTLLSSGVDDFIIHAGTGSGKTVINLYIWATYIKRTALVIVPKTDLLEGKNGWIAKIKKFTNIPEERIGVVRQDTCEFEGKDIVVGMIHSLCKDKYPEEFKRYFGLVIFDELHKLGAQYFSRVGGMFPAQRRIGCTATLRRQDGLIRAFYDHLGKQVVTQEFSDNPVPRVISVEYEDGTAFVPEGIMDKINRRGFIIKRLSRNKNRTAMIASFVRDLVDSGRRTLILSERIPHVMEIRDLLVGKYGLSPEDVGVYISKTSDSERDRISEECPVIVATTSMMSLGTDIPTLRALLFATPLADVEQAIGRICRIGPEIEPVVVDILDVGYKDAENWNRARSSFYARKNCTVQKLSMKGVSFR